MTRKAPFLAGLFLICMATLMLQIIQTRILSVVSMYYLAFLSISMAMLGMTAGALVVYYRLRAVTPRNVADALSVCSTLFSLVTATCFIIQLASPLAIVRVATILVMWVKVLVLLALPFVVSGVVVSLALTRSPFATGLTYAVDLVGAAFGCLVVLLLLNSIDAPSAIFVVAALAALAGVCFQAAGGERAATGLAMLEARLLRRPGLVAVTLLAVALVNTATRSGLQPLSAKLNRIESPSAFEFEEWNSFSRIAASRTFKGPPLLWGASSTLSTGLVVEQRGLNIDGFAGTVMPRFTGDANAVDFLRYDITNLAYAARNDGRVAIIGVGGGRDVLSAHIFGVRDVTGVEVNPVFIDLLTDPDKLRGYAGIADLTGVRLIVDEGRSWFTRTQERFDLIQMSMIDTFAATGAGAFSLSENGLYTVEGWRIFLSALSPRGLFTVSRWHAPSAPIEIGRTTSLAVAALMSLGVPNPRDHIYLASAGNLATLIVSRQPLTAVDLESLNQRARKLNFTVLVEPGEITAEPVLRDVLSAVSIDDLNERAGAYWLDLSPPTDARPFFFNQLRIFNLRNLHHFIEEYRRTGSSAASFVVVGNVVATATLFMLIVFSVIAVVFAVVLPARSAIYRVDARLARLGSAYFVLIGLGFMFIEIGLIQRMSVFLGHPSYALSVVLFSIILSTGIGSLLSERFIPMRAGGVMTWLLLLVVYLLALPHWLPALTHSSLEAASLVTRSAISVGVILPIGLLMGFGFPLGMRLVISRDDRPTPWFWGVNGAAGVLAAGLAVATSIAFSIDTTIRVGAVCYLLLVPTTLMLMAIPSLASKETTVPLDARTTETQPRL
jgi:spermidine synthase